MLPKQGRCCSDQERPEQTTREVQAKTKRGEDILCSILKKGISVREGTGSIPLSRVYILLGTIS